jgi:RNA-directed DNA polymerase
MMNEHGKSDRPIVPEKSPNQAQRLAREEREGRGLAKGTLPQQNMFRTQGREDVHSALERVREAARRETETRFTALFHYVYDPEMLGYAYQKLKRDAAPGVDGETWRHYGENLEANLEANPPGAIP